MSRNYWVSRFHNGLLGFLKSEIEEGRLRQGWGGAGQDLRGNDLDKGTKGNLNMLQVKKGDIVLSPRIPDWGTVTILEATEDWDKAYRFEVVEEYGDFGHIFPVKKIKHFARGSSAVSGDFRRALGRRPRFYSINDVADDVEKILKAEPSEAEKSTSTADKLEGVVAEAFDEEKFSNSLFEKLNKEFFNQEWEWVLIEVFKKMFPDYRVVGVGGKSEVHHGTDILIRIPSIIKGFEYLIAIQVRDYHHFVNEAHSKETVEKINKASYFEEKENAKLVDKIIIVTGAKKEENPVLLEKAEEAGVKVIFASDLKDILCEAGKLLINDID